MVKSVNPNDYYMWAMKKWENKITCVSALSKPLKGWKKEGLLCDVGASSFI